MSFLRSFVAPVCAVLAGSIALGCEKPEPTVREKPTLSPRGYDGSINARLLHRFAPVPVNGFPRQ